MAELIGYKTDDIHKENLDKIKEKFLSGLPNNKLGFKNEHYDLFTLIYTQEI